MVRKLKLGWEPKPKSQSYCKGNILTTNYYRGCSICWATYKTQLVTYLRYPDKSMFFVFSSIPAYVVKKNIDGELAINWLHGNIDQRLAELDNG